MDVVTLMMDNLVNQAAKWRRVRRASNPAIATLPWWPRSHGLSRAAASWRPPSLTVRPHDRVPLARKADARRRRADRRRRTRGLHADCHPGATGRRPPAFRSALAVARVLVHCCARSQGERPLRLSHFHSSSLTSSSSPLSPPPPSCLLLSTCRASSSHRAVPSPLTAVPLLKVVMPSSPYDAKGLLLAAVRDPNPVVFLEHKNLYQVGPLLSPRLLSSSSHLSSLTLASLTLLSDSSRLSSLPLPAASQRGARRRL